MALAGTALLFRLRGCVLASVRGVGFARSGVWGGSCLSEAALLAGRTAGGCVPLSGNVLHSDPSLLIDRVSGTKLIVCHQQNTELECFLEEVRGQTDMIELLESYKSPHKTSIGFVCV